MCKKYQLTNTSEIYTKNTAVMSNCQSISFKNIGNDPVEVIQTPLNPGDAMLSFSNSDPEVEDITRYALKFQGTGNNPRIVVYRSFINCICNNK
jgi:hypothetical protein